MKVFVSYNHKQGDWVWNQLVPCLKAGGAEVLIDRERFEAGRTVVGQMDTTQDQADIHVLILCEHYLKSSMCRHEMDRAIQTDPKFTWGTVVPVRRDDTKLPAKISQPNPLYVDLSDGTKGDQWTRLLAACR